MNVTQTDICSDACPPLDLSAALGHTALPSYDPKTRRFEDWWRHDSIMDIGVRNGETRPQRERRVAELAWRRGEECADRKSAASLAAYSRWIAKLDTRIPLLVVIVWIIGWAFGYLCFAK